MEPSGPATLPPPTEHPRGLPINEKRSHIRKPYSRHVRKLPRWLTYHIMGNPPKKPYRYYLRKLPWWSLNYMWLVRYDALFLLLTYLVAGACLLYLPIFRIGERRFLVRYDKTLETWYGKAAISQPMSNTVLSTLNTALLCALLPLLIVVLMQRFVRNFWDGSSAKWGLLKALAMMTIIQEIFKKFIARPRPWFFSECSLNNPKITDRATEATKQLSDYSRQWVTISDCINPPSLDAMMSYPSGHTGSAFAAGVFLALYLNAKLKAFSNYHTNFGKQMAVVAPLMGALLIAMSMIVGRDHHASDILLSIPLGVFCALLAYRSQYHSLFDYRNNHIPLPYRTTSQRFQAFKSKETSPQTVYGVDENDQTQKDTIYPDKYLAVRWPFSADEKRGPIALKKDAYEPTSILPRFHSTQASDIHRPNAHGTSREAVWSMSRASNAPATYRNARGSASVGQASTIVRTPNRERTQSMDWAPQGGEAASVRTRDDLGSGVGSEAREMV